MLIVDDDEAVLLGSAEYFRQQGWIVDAAREKEEAEALLARRVYDVVVSDLRLMGWESVEGLDVLAVAGSLRPKPLRVLLSAYLTQETEREAMRDGVDRIIRKPMSPTALKQIVLDLLGESP